MKPKFITIHCSANRAGQYLTAEMIRKYHTDPKPHGKGWSDIGYHFVIRTDGALENGRPLSRNGAHVHGHNTDNIGICMVGGLNSDGVPENTFTPEQINTLYRFVNELREEFSIPLANVLGHRDWSPDSNGDGIITKNEYIKACPCFNVKQWYLNKLKADRLL